MSEALLMHSNWLKEKGVKNGPLQSCCILWCVHRRARKLHLSLDEYSMGKHKGCFPTFAVASLVNLLVQTSAPHPRVFEPGTCWHESSQMPNNLGDNQLNSSLGLHWMNTYFYIELNYLAATSEIQYVKLHPIICWLLIL